MYVTGEHTEKLKNLYNYILNLFAFNSYSCIITIEKSGVFTFFLSNDTLSPPFWVEDY